jgi:uncharacterized protein YybS (DUF2232 family)
MNNDEFQRYVIKYLDNIEKRLTQLEETLRTWQYIGKVLLVLISIILGKMGIDVMNFIR